MQERATQPRTEEGWPLDYGFSAGRSTERHHSSDLAPRIQWLMRQP